MFHISIANSFLQLENTMQELNSEEIEIINGGPQEANVPHP